ncbi:MAG: divalent-cation tolerance protein CutA [Planctomycetaceae bacterium]|jgi:periplasmic divalent cation tolerance protein|nr:divalent-cation tolerance protein CutA [Planctomycetaceae bacterium]
MKMHGDYIQVQITFPSPESAEETASALVRERLAACAQVCGTVRSVYIWNGICENSQETLLLAKTKLSLFERLEAAVKTRHPYECPQIVALPIQKANEDYLQWMEEQLSAPADS